MLHPSSFRHLIEIPINSLSYAKESLTVAGFKIPRNELKIIIFGVRTGLTRFVVDSYENLIKT